MLRSTSRKVTVAVAAIMITAGAGAATAAALSGSTDDAGLAVPAAVALDRSAVDVPVRPAPYYHALERSSQKPVARVTQAQQVLATRFPDVAGRSFRGLKAADGTQAWVVSGSKHTCLGVDNPEGTGFTCQPNDQALDGISLAEKRTNGTQRSVLLVPDDIASVSADGRVAAAKNNLVVTEHRVGAVVKANPSGGGSPFRVGTE